MSATAGAAEAKTEEDGPWLNAWLDPVAGLKAYSSCVRFADLDGTGEHKLLIADFDQKLKIYAGTVMVAKHTLLDVPVALCTFYTDSTLPRKPAVAVASGPYVFIYRNLRPYFKFTLPPVDIDKQEKEVWHDLEQGRMDTAMAYEMLSVARDSGTFLSSRSLDLLALDSDEDRAAYVKRVEGVPLVQQTVITCMETLNKNVEGETAVSSLVIGTESRQVLVLDPPGSSILAKVTLPGVPVNLGVTGLHDVDYRIVVACRDGNIYTIKNGERISTVIELETQPVGLVRIDAPGKQILVATMNNAVHSFHVKGKKRHTLYMPAPVVDLGVIRIRRSRITNVLMVALANGEVRFYNDKCLVTTMKLKSRITGCRFGPYQRNDNTLACVFKDGSLAIKMLRRTATLEATDEKPGPPPEQDVPLRVPKKTKLYVEQTQRERDQATDMHRIFQRDLCKLRLATARSYVKIITDGQGPLSYASGASLRLNAQVQGLGPKFVIKLNVQNTGSRAMSGIPITFAYNHELYRIDRSLVLVPLLIPRLLYHFEIGVTCIDEAGGADVIKVFVCSPKSVVPVISAFVTMPISEPIMAD